MLSIPLWRTCQLKKEAWLFGGQNVGASQSHMSGCRETRWWLAPTERQQSTPLLPFQSPHSETGGRGAGKGVSRHWCLYLSHSIAFRPKRCWFWEEWGFKTKCW